MELDGAWRAAQADDGLRRSFPDPALDDGDWATIAVPGQWRSETAFARSDGPLFVRRSFETPPPAKDGGEQRWWLEFDGVFYQSDVWLDGSYLGDTEGYFAPHAFEVTEALAQRAQHTLAVEVSCTRPDDLTAKRNLTGIFQHWDCLDMDWNPGGIWGGVRVVPTGPVRISSLRVLCNDARPERAILDFEAQLDAADATAITVTTTVGPHADDPTGTTAEVLVERSADERLSAGRNRVRWRVTIDRPVLWWPRALGAQPLHDVIVRVAVDGIVSDEQTRVTGLRQVRMRNFIASVNGERLFLKGANLGPVRRELATTTAAQCATDIDLAAAAGLDLLRLHAHIGRPELYDAADRRGMLIWQDLPLQWGYTNVRRQAVRQARQAVDLLGHHPSIAVWCGHNEPFGLAIPAGGEIDAATARRFTAGQLLPGYNKTVLDTSVKRALERADRSRPVVAHSGVLPHPSGGTDTHLYCGWYHGDERDLPGILRRLPILARFLSEFGAQAVPSSAEWMEPDRWPELDWDRLAASGLQKSIFDRRVPPADHSSFTAWQQATQDYQSEVVRHHVETLRRLKYRPTGGFCQFLLADAEPAVSWSVLDHRRVPKAGYRALAAACAPVIVVADRLPAAYHPGDRVVLAVHAVSDQRTPLEGAVVTAVLRWPGGDRTWRFGGDIGADSCVRVGRIDHVLPAGSSAGTVTVDLECTWQSADDGPHPSSASSAVNHYEAAFDLGDGPEAPVVRVPRRRRRLRH